MRFQTIVAPTITELFERQIQGMILSGQVEPGEKLPTEAELAENMHISKSAVHAGIKNTVPVPAVCPTPTPTSSISLLSP